jgi:hypothetical protein
MDPSSRYGKTFRIIFWSISRWKIGLSSKNFLGWVEQSEDILMLRHEDHFIEKIVFQPKPRC